MARRPVGRRSPSWLRRRSHLALTSSQILSRPVASGRPYIDTVFYGGRQSVTAPPRTPPMAQRSIQRKDVATRHTWEAAHG
jgi:hypothetical protein